MKTFITRKQITVVANILCLLFASCSSIHQISSKPPVSAIEIKSGFSDPSIPFLTGCLPPGIYRPLYEDSDGYFYQAPEKVLVNTTTRNFILDGGLYVRRGSTEPKEWYNINPYGWPRIFSLKTIPPYKLIP